MSASAYELLSIGPRTIADQPGPVWGPSWLAEPLPEVPIPVESPGIVEPPAAELPAVEVDNDTSPATTGEVCTRCGFTGPHRDTPIHGGRSTRRDCGRCNLTQGFPVWNPQP